MGSFRTPGVTRRSFGVALVLAATLVFASCGSSSSGTSTTTTDAPSVASSIPPSPSTIPATLQGPCSALASALAMSELHPKNKGNWSAEQQRILTDAASNIALFDAATAGVPEDVATALGTLKGYSTWLGKAMASAPNFDAAVTAVNAYPDLVGASLATSIVDNWKRKNC